MLPYVSDRQQHPVNSTYRGDQSFAPVQADVPPELERQLSQKHVIEALSEPADHRRDSGAYVRKVPSRKPTSSYGIDPITGQPDEGATGLDLAQVDWSQLIEGHTGPAQIQPSSQRKVPSRKPTASYGFDPVANTEATSGPVTGLVTAPIALDDLEHPYDATDPGTNTTPMMFFEQNNPAMNHAQDPAFQEMPDRPSLKDSKQSTLQDIHVPGEYPKDQKSWIFVVYLPCRRKKCSQIEYISISINTLKFQNQALAEILKQLFNANGLVLNTFVYAISCSGSALKKFGLKKWT